MAASYAVYHGPDGLKRIANKVHGLASITKIALEEMGHEVLNASFFDTLTVSLSGVASDVVHAEADKASINLRRIDDASVGVTFDESISLEDVVTLLGVFAAATSKRRKTAYKADAAAVVALAEKHGFASALSSSEIDLKAIPAQSRRTSDFLTQSVFNSHRSETEMMRYLHYLTSKDLSLVHSITALGSCTMKLNSASSLMPLSFAEFSSLHPFAPVDQAEGYKTIVEELSQDLATITGLPGVSLQPNSGAQGEYAGLSVIRAYHHSRGDKHRDICLIPQSAHGTNPASAIMAGMKVVPVKASANGDLDLKDLSAKAEKYKDSLAALMVATQLFFSLSVGLFEGFRSHTLQRMACTSPASKRRAESSMRMAGKSTSMAPI